MVEAKIELEPDSDCTPLYCSPNLPDHQEPRRHFVKHVDSKVLSQICRIWISRELVDWYIGKNLRICMFIFYAPFPSQVMLMTRHIWEILPYTLLCCSAQSHCVLLWGSPARTPHCMPTASAHEGALARAQVDLFEHRRHPGKFYWWGQVAEALGRNTPQGSIHEKAGSQDFFCSVIQWCYTAGRGAVIVFGHDYPLAHRVPGWWQW